MAREIMTKTITILNIKPFCLFKKREIGIASGYFAGNKFASTEGNEYITKVSGQSFGWIDNNGEYWCESKHDMTRPTESQVIEACEKSLFLENYARKHNLIK